MNKLFFPQMVLTTAEPRKPVPQVITGEPKRLIPGSEWDVFNQINARPRKPGTNEYLTESIVEGVDKTGK